MKKTNKPQHQKAVRRTSIGGQAVLEGVMMKGEHAVATAVRTESGEITIESKRTKSPKERNWFLRLPFIRGVVNLCTQLFEGTGLLLRSAEVYGDFAEPTKFEKWLADKFKINAMNVIMGFSLILGLALAVALFVLLPNYLAGLLFEIPALNNAHPALYSLVEGVIMIIIFVLYILIVSLMKDVRRVFMYHGAEHRTINCYEHGLDLTVENVQKQSRQHSRCGTTFMFLVIVVSIITFAFVNWALSALGWLVPADQKAASILNALIKVPCKLVFIPVVAGVSYEILKLLAKSDNWFFRMLRAPGMALQMLTTKAPDDSMAEVAIAAFKAVQEMDADPSVPERKFDIRVPYAIARSRVKDVAKGADESDIDWIFVYATSKARSELKSLQMISSAEYDCAMGVANKMKGGEPLQYALGNTEFYGLKLSLNRNVLIPRPETELLVEQAIKVGGERVLDLCTGSGAIALAIKKNLPTSFVKATDVSSSALDVARSNALMCGVQVEFEQADMLDFKSEQKFDLIVSNPPYIPSADCDKLDAKVKDFEPRLALDGGKDGLDFYRKIASKLDEKLSDDGTLLLEIGIGESDGIKDVFASYSVDFIKDYDGVLRIAEIKRKNG